MGEALKAARKRTGLTQTELGEKCGIKQPNIVAIEKGDISLAQLEKIADALGLSLEALLE